MTNEKNMTNEEKANAIAEYDDENYIHRYAGAMQMAKWKDEQINALKAKMKADLIEKAYDWLENNITDFLDRSDYMGQAFKDAMNKQL